MNALVMTMLLSVGWGIFGWSARRRWRLMRVGAAAGRFDQPGRRLRAVWHYGLKQLRMRRYPLAGIAHMLVFSGFCVLILRSLILWGRGFDESFSFWLFGIDQPLGKVYALLKDVFAVLVIGGTLVFVYYRVIRRLPRMTLSVEGLVILGIILVMMLADIVYDGASMVLAAHAGATATAAPVIEFHVWEPAASIAQFGVAGLSSGALECLRHAGFWTHSTLVLVFLNLLPFSKHFHVITGLPNVYLQDLAPPGRLRPMQDMDGMIEREETLGIKRINQFSWKSILDFYTCTECGRCSDHCPATNTGKKLSPKHLTLDLRDFLYRHEQELVADARRDTASGGDDGPPHHKDLVDGVIDPEVLWACTSCRACEQECPVFITYVDKIVDMRRYLVQERGAFPGELQSAFRNLESTANPWGFQAEERAQWASDLGIKTLADDPEAPVIFWVGCAGSFDERAKSVSRATARLLQHAGIRFAILGCEEQCTGDPARRAGNEYLFQMFARQNVETLNNYGADRKKIVTTCPHCFNTLLNEYPDFGGRFDVVHHSTFLADLLRQGKLKPTNTVDRTIVYHDSCYLGRYNEVYEPPRETMKRIPGLTVLEPLQSRDRGMCCGAGGAQMFKEEEPGSGRVSDARTDQLLDTQPEVVSSACPFCMRMLTDGLANANREDVPALDVAEVLLEAVNTEPQP